MSLFCVYFDNASKKVKDGLVDPKTCQQNTVQIIKFIMLKCTLTCCLMIVSIRMYSIIITVKAWYSDTV